MRNQTVCFTGHRQIEKTVLPSLARQLETVLRRLIEEGCRYFGAGGALGFDTLAAQTVLRLREEFPYIRLILVLPCRNQTKNWPPESVAEYRRILGLADKAVYVSQDYFPGCMQKRNRWMVDESSVCVAYCTRSTGGSAYTLDYARRQGLRAILLDP